MFIIDTLSSVLKYLQDGKTNYYPAVKTIDVYKGQLAEAMKGKQIITLSDPLPAVYMVMIDDNPLAEDPVHNIDLVIIAESKVFNKGEKQTAAYSASDNICSYINSNQGWDYSGVPYMIDKERVKITHLMTDNKYTILNMNLTIKNLK